MEIVLGKSSGTSLVEHTGDVLRAVSVLRERSRGQFPEEWWKALQYAALFHDLGKIDPLFQAKLRGNAREQDGVEIPHGLLSLLLFRPEKLKFLSPESLGVLLSAVGFHHWRDSFPDLLMGYRTAEIRQKADELQATADYWEEQTSRIREELSDIAEEFDLTVEALEVNTYLLEYLKYNDLGTAGLLVPPYTLSFLPAKLREQGKAEDGEKYRIFVSGNLMRADHFASLVEDGGTGLRIADIEWGEPLTADQVRHRLAAEFGGDGCWQVEFFARNPSLQGNNLVLVAPTGFGKTEFAYLWGAGRKNLMTLPMRAAANKIFDRASGLMGMERTALLHGDAALELFVRDVPARHEHYEGERRQALDMARHLAKPYIVATADQIAPAALRYPGYERIFAILMDGALVIDEVQAYDPRAAAIVTHLIQQNAAFGGKTLLMTATLPPFIRDAIKERTGLDDQHVVRLLDTPGFESFAESSRHRVRVVVHDGTYACPADQILAAARSGLKVLVIMNTVREARTIYRLLKTGLNEGKGVQIALLHSRFTQEQRRELEKRVVDNYMPNRPHRDEAPCIVVTTQIVEASLDLDADVMFTELAPADSLVQRMGRVYRRFARQPGNNAPMEPNVIIMVNAGEQVNRNTQNEDARLASGIGKVYDRNLTALSLVTLLNAFDNPSYLFDADIPSVLEEEPWNLCFQHKKSGKKRTSRGINQALCDEVRERENKTLLLNEKMKVHWVELTYRLLENGMDPNFSLELGGYLSQYYETLEILDHGYCSDKRRDAMRLFRDVNDIKGIPAEMVEEFYDVVLHWVDTCHGRINYLELAVNILPAFIVSCPYYALNKGDYRYYSDLSIERMVSNRLDQSTYGKVLDKLERWLSDVKVIQLPYHPEEGMLYLDE